MKRNYRKILRNRKNRIARRLAPKQWADQPRPMLKASNIHYEMAGRVNAVSCGGIGAMHLLVQRLGLVEDLKRLQPSPRKLRESCATVGGGECIAMMT